ncbi:MAG: bestrophin family protein, partial [Crocinitomicaceae bacterium]
MIKYNPKIWFKHIISFNHSDTINKLWKELIALGIFTLGIAYIEIKYIGNTEKLSELMQVYSLIGFVLSLLLVFRTNTAYDRWWEGRKKWGELVNNSRNLAIKISALTDDPEIRAYFKRMISNYVFAMKEHLREGVKLEELDLTEEEKKELSQFDHKPNYIAQKMYAKLHAMKQSGKLTEENYIVIDVNLKTFSDIIGACERIKNTPIPYSYSMFLKKFIFIYVTTLPLAFVNTFGYYSSLVSIFVFYVLVSMEILAEEIEDPFGKDDNDLPTDDLCQK